MKAPDKIYLNSLLMEDGESIVRRCTFERQRDSQVEYTRTDAFIKKAVNYMNNHLPIITTNIALSDEKYATILKEKCIEDFRNYMKGE